jgi:hypothetical protein
LSIYLENIKEYFGPHPIEEYKISLYGNDKLQFTSPREPINENSFINKDANFRESVEILEDAPLHTMYFNPFYEKQGYVGIKKQMNGEYYYGWMRLKVDNNNNLVIYDLAISTCENASIKVGYHR